MDDLCGEIPFWNQSLTWDTELPSLTKCFRRTIFTLAPSAIFWFIYPFYIWHLGKENKSTSTFMEVVQTNSSLIMVQNFKNLVNGTTCEKQIP